jgi:rubrerythrin
MSTLLEDVRKAELIKQTNKDAWYCSGFERNAKAEVQLFWACSVCDYEVKGKGLNAPDFVCPCCGGKKP